MSGFVSPLISTIGGLAVSAYTQAFGSMGDVTLGDFGFLETEVPAQITWSGCQRIVRHVAPGGTVVMNVMGIDYPPISWRGVLEGPDASDRAQHLYALMSLGQQVTLAWLDQSYQVVVREVSFDHQHVSWIPYQVSCEVLSRSDAGPPPDNAALDAIFAYEVAQALISGIVGLALHAVQKTQTASGQPGAFTPRSAAFLGLTVAVGAAGVALAGDQLGAEAGLTALAVAAGPGQLIPSDPYGAAGNVQSAVAMTGALASTVVAAGFMGEALSNMSAVSG